MRELAPGIMIGKGTADRPQDDSRKHGQHHHHSHQGSGPRRMLDPEHHGNDEGLASELTDKLSLSE